MNEGMRVKTVNYFEFIFLQILSQLKREKQFIDQNYTEYHFKQRQNWVNAEPMNLYINQET